MRLFTWPNRVTITRIGLLFVLVVLVYHQRIWARFLAASLAVLLIVMDWLAVTAAVMCLIRGIPVILEGSSLIQETEGKLK